jgi:hypothetical protein
MKRLLHPLFCEFKWYRKKKSGIWFRVYEKGGFNTFDGASMYWTQTPPDRPHEVLLVEKW